MCICGNELTFGDTTNFNDMFCFPGAPKGRRMGRWSSIPGRLTRISRGRAGTWGVNKHGHIYRLNSNGKYMHTFDGDCLPIKIDHPSSRKDLLRTDS